MQCMRTLPNGNKRNEINSPFYNAENSRREVSMKIRSNLSRTGIWRWAAAAAQGKSSLLKDDSDRWNRSLFPSDLTRGQHLT